MTDEDYEALKVEVERIGAERRAAILARAAEAKQAWGRTLALLAEDPDDKQRREEMGS